MNRSNPPPPPSNPWDTTDSNSILPDNTAQGYPNYGSNMPDSFQSSPMDSNIKLNGEQIDWLIKRMSSDDQKELGKLLRDCTMEMTLTRGLPFAAVCTGAMYYARTRLPEKLQFGPKRWPFYAMIAVGAMTAANVLYMNKCGQRVKPRLNQLYQKYSENQPTLTNSYDSLRAANRQHVAPPMQEQYGIASQQPPVMNDPRAQKPGYLYEDPPTISGTPNSQQPRGNNGYGDKGWS